MISMTEVMDILLTYLCEGSYKEFLPREYYWRYSRLAEKQESDFLAACSEPQREMFDEFQSTQNLLHGQEMEAMFLAAWNLFKELR